ncbi:MAG: tetratricopeptide repeat protein [Calditrichaeota bacterium]|nr:MAG: tetratricopeptide repeat protein [Calditrichota bacterium]
MNFLKLSFFLIIFSFANQVFGFDDIKFSKFIPEAKHRMALSEISDFGVSENGNFYVLDKKSNSLHSFSSDGKIIKSLKSGLKSPSGIFVSSKDKIYVCDTDNKKVKVFSKDLISELEFGFAGGSYGELNSPEDIAVNSFGQIFVLDRDRNSVLMFNEKGFFLSEQSFEEPIAIAVDFEDKLNVLYKEGDNFGIYVFQNYFEKLNQFYPLNNNQITSKELVDLKVNGYGEFYLLDSKLGNCWHLDAMAKPIGRRKFGNKSKNSGPAAFNEASFLAVVTQDENSDIVYIADKKFGLIQEINIQIKQSRYADKTVLSEPILVEFLGERSVEFSDLTFTGKGLLATSKENNSVKYFESMSILSGGQTYTKDSAKKLGFEMGEPSATATFGDKVFVVNTDEHQVLIFDAEGNYQFSFSEKGSSEGKLKSPTDLAISNDGKIHVCDTDNNRISVFSTDGIFLSFFPKKSNLLEEPKSIAIDSKGIIYVLDKSNTIYIFDGSKAPKKIIPDSKDFSFSRIEVTDSDLLLVVEEETQRVQIFKNFRKVAEFGSKGEKEDSNRFAEISGIYFNASKNEVYVSDSEAKRTKVFKVLEKPSAPKNLRLVVTDPLRAKLVWEHEFNNLQFEIYRFKDYAEKAEKLFVTDARSFTISESTEEVYGYFVKSYKAGLRSNASNSIEDKVTAASQNVKKSNYFQAIKHLKSSLIFIENKDEVTDKIIELYILSQREEQANGNFRLALSYIDEALEIQPNNLDLFEEKVKCYKGLGDLDKAIDIYSQIQSKFAMNKQFNVAFMKLYIFANRFMKAIILANNYHSKKGFDKNIELLKAKAYEGDVEFTEALKIYKTILSKTGDKNLHLNIGDLYVEMKRYEDAIAEYQKAQDINYPRSIVYLKIGIANYEKGNYPESSFQIEKAIQIDPKQAELHYNLGKAYSKDKKKQEAVNAFKRAIDLNNSYFDAYLALGNDYEVLNQLDDAQVEYEKAVKLSPKNVEARFALGKIYLKAKKADDAVAELTIANEENPYSNEILAFLKEAQSLRRKINITRDPIEVADYDLVKVFPSLWEYYKTHPIGTIEVFNTKNRSVLDVKVTLEVPKVCDEPLEFIIPTVLENRKDEYLLNVKFNESLLEATTSANLTLETTLTIFYRVDGTPYTKVIKKDLEIQKLNDISWRDKKQISSFINPRDQIIRDLMTEKIISQFSEVGSNAPLSKQIRQAMQIFTVLGDLGISYVADPNTPYETASLSTDVIDYVQFPVQTLQRKVGDCDDLVTLLSNCYESIGIATAYIDVPGHVFLAFSPYDIQESNLTEQGVKEDMVIKRFGKIWIPIETTLLGKSTFYEAWSKGIQRYKETIENGEIPEIIEIANAAKIYPPVNYTYKSSLSGLGLDSRAFEASKNKFQNEVQNIANISEKSIENQLKEAISQYPKNSFLRNRLGLFYIQQKKYGKAIESFKAILNYDATNVIAINNLGNAYIFQNRLPEAETYLLEATEKKPEDAGILVNLCKLYLERGEKAKAEKFYQKAFMVDTDFVLENFADISQEFRKN